MSKRDKELLLELGLSLRERGHVATPPEEEAMRTAVARAEFATYSLMGTVVPLMVAAWLVPVREVFSWQTRPGNIWRPLLRGTRNSVGVMVVGVLYSHVVRMYIDRSLLHELVSNGSPAMQETIASLVQTKYPHREGLIKKMPAKSEKVDVMTEEFVSDAGGGDRGSEAS